MNRFRNYLKHIKIQISIFFLIASLVIIMLLGSIFYYGISNIVLESELSNTADSVIRSGKYIETYIDKLKSLSYIVSNDGATLKYLKTQNQDDRKDLLSLIDRTLETDEFFSSIIIVSKSGELISNEKTIDMTVSSDMMNEKWYVNALSSDSMPFLSSIRQQKFTMDKETWVISISQEIVDKTSENIGVLLMDIKYEVIENYLKDLNLGSDGFSFIINDNSDIVYHPDPSYFEEQALRDELISINEMKDGYNVEMGKLTYHYNIEGTNWTLVGLSSLDQLSIIKRQMIELIVMAGIILFVVVVIGGNFIAKRITNPIVSLENAMMNISDNLNTIDIDKNTCSEVTSLTHYYNDMTFKIKELMSDISKSEEYLRNYEISALHSQINPHFLYNTLDTIVWMAEFDDSQMVIEVTKSLANFFRLSLSGGSEKITFEDEINHVSEYLFIQDIRYGDKLSYNFKIDENVKNIIVPKIILQPIVENAIYHGIKESDRDGIIDIIAKLDGENLVIDVIDNGVGFDVNNPVLKDVKLGGVGLANVDRRLKLYYGQNYGVNTSSEIG
ncbi:MAG: sensor histidine kinase, partial [Acidaminobacteraceae bacterium]